MHLTTYLPVLYIERMHDNIYTTLDKGLSNIRLVSWCSVQDEL